MDELPRKILHVDMDAFYASVEQRDFPRYRGRPLIVGGSPSSRGVVATASYEARAFGVRSAMSAAKAARLCPDAIFVPPRFSAYKEVSRQLHAIFAAYTDRVEPLSLDEAYLDVSSSRTGETSATRIAREIRQRIRSELHLTASAGVAPNKFIAKLASEYRKPDGLTVVQPHQVDAFLKDMPVRRVHGIGSATEKRMQALGIQTITDLKGWTEAALTSHFGRAGSWYFQLARGHDPRPVDATRERRSLGTENTFAEDCDDVEWMSAYLKELAGEVWELMARSSFQARTVTLKVTYADFQKITRSRTLEHPAEHAHQIWEVGDELLRLHTEAGPRKVRLLGLSTSNPEGERSRPPPLPPDGAQLWLPFPGRDHHG